MLLLLLLLEDAMIVAVSGHVMLGLRDLLTVSFFFFFFLFFVFYQSGPHLYVDDFRFIFIGRTPTGTYNQYEQPRAVSAFNEPRDSTDINYKCRPRRRHLNNGRNNVRTEVVVFYISCIYTCM